jgi:hypothetical protein
MFAQPKPKADNPVHPFSHFQIFADINNDEVFNAVLKELNLDDIFKNKYQMTVNLHPDVVIEGSYEPYVVIGRYKSPNVELDSTAYRYLWTDLSLQTRLKVLEYEYKYGHSPGKITSKKHFRVFADINKDEIFSYVLFELGLDTVFKDKYQMAVNTAPENGNDPYVVIGKYKSADVEKDRTAYRYLWSNLNLFTRKKILSYEAEFKI